MVTPIRVFIVLGAVIILGPFVYGAFLDTHQVFYRDPTASGRPGDWQPGGRGPGPDDCPPLLARAREATPEGLRATREFMCRRV